MLLSSQEHPLFSFSWSNAMLEKTLMFGSLPPKKRDDIQYTQKYPEIPRNTQKYPRVKKIPENTRSYISTLLPDPNPTRYPVFFPIPDPTRPDIEKPYPLGTGQARQNEANSHENSWHALPQIEKPWG